MGGQKLTSGRTTIVAPTQTSSLPSHMTFYANRAERFPPVESRGSLTSWREKDTVPQRTRGESPPPEGWGVSLG